MKKINLRKITVCAMLCAVAYALVILCRVSIIPSAPFLEYEPKDVIIAVAGFIYGPLYSIIMSLVVSFVEMITISSTGIIGFIMNTISTCAFAGTAALIYKYRKNYKSLIIGLAAGVLLSTASMILWNYLITPLYTMTPREAVAEMLIPVFLPFNLIKNCANSILAVLLYKPLIQILRKTKSVE